jgi:hypothetical protein
MELSIESLSKESFLTFLENEANIRMDGFLESAIAVAEEVHEGVNREDGISSFLNTHIWPVAKNVTVHYRRNNKPITTVEIASAFTSPGDRVLINLYETNLMVGIPAISVWKSRA